MTSHDDIARYRALLSDIALQARELRWAEERPWAVHTHVDWEGPLPVVDLHDLNARLSREALRLLLEHPAEVGAVVLVHGRGRHTAGPTSVLRGVVHKELRRACQRTPGWSYRLLGAGRTVWISDRARAPREATGGLSWWFWLWIALIALAALAPLLVR
jgi:hypothetical protein